MKFLIICGPSSGGKSYIKEKLCLDYHQTYISVPQFTTRCKRCLEDEVAYLFVSNNAFNSVEKFLIGKTQINDTRYGSLMPARKTEDYIYVIILNEAGLHDFLNNISDEHKYHIIGITRNNLEREGRTREYIEEEKKILLKCDKVFDGADSFINPDDVHNYLRTIKF